jgi:hypothetical protein
MAKSTRAGKYDQGAPPVSIRGHDLYYLLDVLEYNMAEALQDLIAKRLITHHPDMVEAFRKYGKDRLIAIINDYVVAPSLSPRVTGKGKTKSMMRDLLLFYALADLKNAPYWNACKYKKEELAKALQADMERIIKERKMRINKAYHYKEVYEFLTYLEKEGVLYRDDKDTRDKAKAYCMSEEAVQELFNLPTEDLLFIVKNSTIPVGADKELLSVLANALRGLKYNNGIRPKVYQKALKGEKFPVPQIDIRKQFGPEFLDRVIGHGKKTAVYLADKYAGSYS